MNLETRKIEFVKEFLELQSEDIISQLENILKKETKNSDNFTFKPMTEEELNQRIDTSESDFRNNRFKTTTNLLTKFD